MRGYGSPNPRLEARADSCHEGRMWILTKIETEYPVLKPATLMVGLFVAGVLVGIWYKNDQVTTAQGETASVRTLLSFREAQIEELLKQLSRKPETAQENKPSEGVADAPEGTAPAPKALPADPDQEIVETSKPKVPDSPVFQKD